MLTQLRMALSIVATGRLLGLFICLLFAAGNAQAVQIVITGLADELEENVQLSLEQPPGERADLIKQFIDSAPKQVKRAMAAVGYYGPKITIKQISREGETVVTIDVEPGDPARVNVLNLRIDGAAQIDAGYMPVIGKIPLRKNAIFNSGDYEASKSVLIDAAQDRGYFDFVFTTNTVRVSRLQLTADIDLIADSGDRYIFGPLRFDQEIFSEVFLSRWAPFKEGDPYESSKLAELTQNLQSSGYFANVRVVPQRDRRYGKTVPVQVSLGRRDDNQIGIGLGFATDTGPRTKLTWSKPLINKAGHSAEAELGLSEVRQNVSFAYRIPRRHQPLTNYWGIEYGLQREDIDDTESFLSTLNFQRARRTPSEWLESVFIRWERERSTIGDVDDETDLVLPGFSYNRSRSRGKPFTTWGQSTSFQFLYGSRELLSSIDFYKSVFSFKYLTAISKRNTLIASVQYGAISTNDFNRTPTSQRFFAGGDRSIRGFGFRDVSPRNSAGDAVGGRYLELSSLEYSYRFLDLWSVALFVDAGRAFNNFDHAYSVGAGVGIRWQSPVGPFRLDLATPVSEDDQNVRIHLSLGPDL